VDDRFLLLYNEKMIYKKPRTGNLKKKVLLLLSAGLALGLTKSPRKQFWILKQIPKELEKLNRQTLQRSIDSLYKSHLIEEKQHKDGTTTLILSKDGKQEALKFNLDKIEIKKPTKWDGKWRIIMFDIPEKSRRLRDSLRFHFQKIGLREFQKSVFIHPFSCEKEIEFILELYNARKYVRFVLAEEIDNELHIKNKFNLF